MNKRKLSFRQLGIITLLATIALKFFALPSLIYEISNNDSFLTSIIMLILDVLMTFLVFVILKRAGNQNFYEYVKMCFGKIFAKIYCVALLLLFLLQIALSLEGLHFFIVENLFIDFKPALFILPLVVVVIYLCVNGDYNIAKVAEVFIWVIIIGVIFIIVSSMGNVEFDFFLPILKDGFKPIINSAYSHIAWFGSFNVLFLFFGRVDLKSNQKKFWFYIIITIFIYSLLFFTFYGLFNITSSQHSFAISDISQISSSSGSLNEIAWLVVVIWMIAQVLQLAIYANVASKSISLLFNCKKDIPIILIGIYMIFCIILSEQITHLRIVFYSTGIKIFVIIIAYILPYILFVASTINYNLHYRGGQKYDKENI